MKKIILLDILITVFAVAIYAQPRAIGMRGSYGIEASYQHALGSNFLEVDVGSFWFKDVHAITVYDWVLASPSAGGGEFSLYAGVGGGLGFGFELWAANGGYHYHIDHNYMYFGVVGQLGLDYTFRFPLQLSIDMRPIFGPTFCISKDRKYHDAWFYGDHDDYYGWMSSFCPVFAVRYHF